MRRRRWRRFPRQARLTLREALERPGESVVDDERILERIVTFDLMVRAEASRIRRGLGHGLRSGRDLARAVAMANIAAVIG